MGLVSRFEPVKHEIRHEPGEWMTFRPLRQAELISLPDSIGAAGMEMIRLSIVAWSYGDYAPEMADDLDQRTANWAAEVVREVSNLGAEEGEASAAV